METLVLPAQDQLAYHQNGRSRRLGGILYSTRMLPRSQSKSCGTLSQRGSATSDPRDVFEFPGDGHSTTGLLPHSENQSASVPRALTLGFFGRSECSPSKGTATTIRSPVADSLVPNSQSLSSKRPSASWRSFSAPKGYGCRRDDGGTLYSVQDGSRASPASESKAGKKGTSRAADREIERYFAKNSTETKAVSGRQSVGRLQGNPFSGRRNLERDGFDTGDNNRSARTGSSKAAVRDGPVGRTEIGALPVVMILQRPKTKDMAVSNLARFFGEGLSVEQEINVCSTVSQSVDADSAVGREKVSTRCMSHGADKQNACSEEGITSSKFSKLKKKCGLTCTVKASRNAAESVNLPSHESMCAVSRKALWNLSMSDTATSRQERMPVETDRTGLPHSMLMVKENGLVSQGKSPMPAGPKATGKTGVVVGCRGEDFSFSSSPPMNERWAGPAFSNSPPPSSLPFPKFSMRQLRTSSLEIPPIGDGFSDDAVGSGSLSAPASPSRSSITLPSQSSPTVGFLGIGLDVAYATKDLRRMLNLDN